MQSTHRPPGAGAADLPRDPQVASQASNQRLTLSRPSKTRRPLTRQGAGSEAVTLGDGGWAAPSASGLPCPSAAPAAPSTSPAVFTLDPGWPVRGLSAFSRACQDPLVRDVRGPWPWSSGHK